MLLLYSLNYITHAPVIQCYCAFRGKTIIGCHHASRHDQGWGVAEHGGRDHEGGGDEIREEPVEQDRLALAQEECKAVQGKMSFQSWTLCIMMQISGTLV